MIDIAEARQPRAHSTLDSLVSGQERAAISVALDKRVDRIAIGSDCGFNETAALVAQDGWLHDGLGAIPHCVFKDGSGVIDREGDISNAVAMQSNVFRNAI